MSKRYAVVLEFAPEGPNWGAYVPDLPGCVATGETQEECRRLIGEAIELHIQGMIEDGETVPEPSTVVDLVEVL